MEEVTATQYNVRRCGYYVEDEHSFGTLAAVMHGLVAWTDGLASIGESATYSPSEDDDILRAFCLDIRELGNGRYLVAMWNELEHSDEGVHVLAANSQIGNANISSVEIDPMGLPGYPAYFCIDVRRQDVLNLRFEQRLNGSRQFQRFVAGFLTSFSEWCVWDSEDDSILLGYSEDEGEDIEIVEGAVAEFATTRGKIAGEVDHLRENVHNIRKVVRKVTVRPVVEAHKSFLDSALNLMGLPVNNRLKADINFQYEFKTRLTEEKLEQAIAHHDQAAPDDSWDDLGFILAKESNKTYWLSGGIARKSLQANVGRTEDGMIDMDDLEAYARANFIRILDGFNE